VARGIREFVEIHTLEHPGTRREPFLRLHLCPRDIPPRRSVGVGWTDGRANGGKGGGDNEPVVVRARVRVQHLHHRGGAGASGGAMVTEITEQYSTVVVDEEICCFDVMCFGIVTCIPTSRPHEKEDGHNAY
jgi:hypothetical protein